MLHLAGEAQIIKLLVRTSGTVWVSLRRWHLLVPLLPRGMGHVPPGIDFLDQNTVGYHRCSLLLAQK